MTTPSLPQQILIAQASALAIGERSLPLALPPLSQSLISIASALPLGALPALPGPAAAGGSPFGGFPTIGGFPTLPLGATPILASLGPRSALRSAANGLGTSIAPRTGLG